MGGGAKGMHTEFWWKSPKERDHQEGPDVDVREI
jgi:hypothetical protein